MGSETSGRSSGNKPASGSASATADSATEVQSRDRPPRCLTAGAVGASAGRLSALSAAAGSTVSACSVSDAAATSVRPSDGSTGGVGSSRGKGTGVSAAATASSAASGGTGSAADCGASAGVASSPAGQRRADRQRPRRWPAPASATPLRRPCGRAEARPGRPPRCRPEAASVRLPRTGYEGTIPGGQTHRSGQRGRRPKPARRSKRCVAPSRGPAVRN